VAAAAGSVGSQDAALAVLSQLAAAFVTVLNRLTQLGGIRQPGAELKNLVHLVVADVAADLFRAKMTTAVNESGGCMCGSMHCIGADSLLLDKSHVSGWQTHQTQPQAAAATASCINELLLLCIQVLRRSIALDIFSRMQAPCWAI
jgi:hypothetical protein